MKDEAALLRKNLAFHRHLGIARIYLFDDGSSDATLATLVGLDDVAARAPAALDEIEDRELASQLAAARATQSPVRQMLNASLALELARADGLDWLLHVDADELVAPSLDRVAPGQLAALLAAQPRAVEAVRFPTLELAQRLDVSRPFEEGVLFKRDPAAFTREIEDPRNGARLLIRGFYGHSIGKCAVRVGVPARPQSPHIFTRRDGRPLRTAVLGHLLHYHLYSAEDFVLKHRRAGVGPERYPGVQVVRAHKRLFRELASDPRFADADLRAYYERSLVIHEAEIARLRAPRLLGLLPMPAKIVRVDAVRDALARLDTGPSAGG